MEFHRYVYTEYDITTYYVIEDGMTKAHINCSSGEIKRSTVKPIPYPINSERVEEEELPGNVREEFGNLLTYYE